MTKDPFLRASECSALGWYLHWEPSEERPTAGDLFLMEEGKRVHERARGLFPDGVFAGTVEQTQLLMEDKNTATIFEAAFKVDGYIARADILQRITSGFRLIEIKSSLFDEDGAKEEHIDDLAYTSMVLTRAGVKVVKAELMLLSREWRIGMPDDQLFALAEHTKAVRERAKEFDAFWSPVKEAVLGKQRPAVKLLRSCGKCPYFETACLGKGVKDPIFDLPRLSEKGFNELSDAACCSIHDIPDAIMLTAGQKRVRDAVVGGKPVIHLPQLRSLLGEVRWPALYLDFETLKTALPLWNGVAPHEQVVTQYSIHRCGSPGDVTGHSEYLADPGNDCREELTVRLLADTEGDGSVIHYSSFEKTMINGLAKRFPALATRLEALVNRLFDMEAFFRQAYCHPEFRGRTSIKVTLPALIPAMAYEDLDIGDGGAAMAAFGRMARDECSPKDAQRLRKALLEYCGQDTLAMVKLHAVMATLSK